MADARAQAKYVPVSPQKVRRVLSLVRGRGLEEALAVLQFTPGRAAAAIRKVLGSAGANAENNHDMDRGRLWVSRAFADAGPSLRRLRSGSMTRAAIIRRRTSHITVVLSEREREAEPARRPAPRRREHGAKSPSA
jgi:large subunit ribosomal protein L22